MILKLNWFRELRAKGNVKCKVVIQLSDSEIHRAEETETNLQSWEKMHMELQPSFDF